MSCVVVPMERRKRWTIAGALVTSGMAALLLGAWAHVAQSQAGAGEQLPRSLELLIGPLPPIGAPKAWKPFDTLQLDQGKKYAESFPAEPQDLTASNFYDLALTLYTIYYRTNDVYWRDRARLVARAWRDSPNNQNIAPFLAGNHALGANTVAPRGASTLGLAILAVESSDPAAKQAVDGQARVMKRFFSSRWFDGRESGYALMAFLCARQLGLGFDAEARALLNIILAAQQPSGQWAGEFASTGLFATVNYMNGILMEALIMYDRDIGDPRILPAIRKAVEWTWSTQWVAATQGFQYADRVVPNWADTTPFPNLNGLLLPAWGHLYARTGDPRYLDQGDKILKGLVEVGGRQIWGVKQFTQMFRSSSRYLGYVALAPPSK